MRPENLSELVIHNVGNKALDTPLFVADKKINIEDELRSILNSYFLSSFKSEEYYHLYHDVNLPLNEVYTYVSNIFDDPGSLLQESKNLAKHLYDKSAHPKIKDGEFYVAYFTDCNLNGETLDAVGLFKSENKETFLEVERSLDSFNLESRQGINISKLDKGCLIFNTDKKKGYVLSIVDNTNKGTEAQYWKDDFLKVLVINNEYHQTTQFLSLTKNFVTKQLDQEFDISKTDQIDLLNRSVEYFKAHDTFDKQEFEEEVFHHQNLIDSFRQFDQTYRRENEVEFSDNFEISDQAVKKQARVFKSVLKLDKNFHIYIHGNRELIEQGVEKDGRKFYKIYYSEEH